MASFKAIIRGAYGEGNFGDDVLMVACHGLLRQVYAADEIAYVFTSDPPVAERRYVERLLPGINIIRFESQAAAELVVWGGGTQFYSFSQSQAVVPFYRKVLAGLLDPEKAYNYLVKKLFGGKFHRGQRFAALGIGVGPFVPDSPNEGYSRDLFAKMNFAAVRDDESMQLCKTWGVRNLTHRSDLCFLPEICWPDYLPVARVNGRGRRIGVIVRDWPHDTAGAAYEKPLINAAEMLRKAGYSVQYILFRANGDCGWARLLSQRGESPLAWNPEVQSITDFLHELDQFDCLLTARYHGALFGALIGRPVICIELEQKLRLVSELLKVGLWRQPFNESSCLELVEQVFAEYSKLERALADAVQQQRQLGQVMMSEFLAFANEPGRD